MFTVLVQRGKSEQTHLVSVETFKTKAEAENFCNSVQSSDKYWVFAQIIELGEEVEIGNPWLEDQKNFVEF